MSPEMRRLRRWACLAYLIGGPVMALVVLLGTFVVGSTGT